MCVQDAAVDLKAQEVITQEVVNFMTRFSKGRVKEVDIAVLVETIRERLAGGTPQ